MEYDTFEMASLAAKHAGDEEIQRCFADREGREALEDMGISLSLGMEVSVVANTKQVFHVVMPADPNAALSDDELLSTSGGVPNKHVLRMRALNAHSTAASFPSCSMTPLPEGS